jgi:hypothetical protein
MRKLIDHIQMNRLLDRLAAVKEKLTPNERELFHKLDDKTCLEVMLRNIEIRRGYALDPKDTVGRIIDLPRTGDAEDP